MRAGELNILASIQKDTAGRDAKYNAALEPVWEEFKPAWVGITALSAREARLAEGFAPTGSLRVKTRWTPALEAAKNDGTIVGMSVLLPATRGGRRLFIVGAMNVEEANTEMWLFVSESQVQASA